MSKKDRSSFSSNYIWIFAIAAALISAVFFGYNWYIVSDWHNVNKAGVRGDAFGGINAFFSGLGIAGVIVAIVMQSAELRYQRQELRENTNSLLLSSYLNALESLRQFYEEEKANVKTSSYDDSPEISPFVKHRMTMDKLEALVRHLEENEEEFAHLASARLGRSREWLRMVTESFWLFEKVWKSELAKRNMEVKKSDHQGKGYIRVGNVSASNLVRAVEILHERLEVQGEEVAKGTLRIEIDLMMRQARRLITAIDEHGKKAKEAMGDTREERIFRPTLAVLSLDELEKECAELRVSGDGFVRKHEEDVGNGIPITFLMP